MTGTSLPPTSPDHTAQSRHDDGPTDARQVSNKVITRKIQMTAAKRYVSVNLNTRAEDHGETKGTRWNGRRRFLGLGAKRYRNRQPIIDAEPPELDGSPKG